MMPLTHKLSSVVLFSNFKKSIFYTKVRVSPPKGVTRCGPHQPQPLGTTLAISVLNHCLEWDKPVLNERTYHTPDSGLTRLLLGRGRSSCSLHCAGLVAPECIRGVIDPLYHSRHNDRDRQYECDRGISSFNTLTYPTPDSGLTYTKLNEKLSTLAGDVREVVVVVVWHDSDPRRAMRQSVSVSDVAGVRSGVVQRRVSDHQVCVVDEYVLFRLQSAS